jgi:hypothetical protein
MLPRQPRFKSCFFNDFLDRNSSQLAKLTGPIKCERYGSKDKVENNGSYLYILVKKRFHPN